MKWQLLRMWDQCQGWRPLAATQTRLMRLDIVAASLAYGDQKTLRHQLEMLGYVHP